MTDFLKLLALLAILVVCGVLAVATLAVLIAFAGVMTLLMHDVGVRVLSALGLS
jgi:hypothetical protein